MPGLELFLLGPFHVTLNGAPLTEFRSDKARALLAYLAAEPGRPHRRETLLDLFWNSENQKATQASLRVTLTNLRRLLQPIEPDQANASLLITTRQSIQLKTTHEACWVDLNVFKQLVAQCDNHPHSNIQACVDCIERLAQASELYRDSFLTGLTLTDAPGFDDWQRHQQEVLYDRLLDILRILTDHHLMQQNYERTQYYARQHIKFEPWSEEAHRQLMWALTLSGQRRAALAQYETCCRILQEEWGEKPSPETTALYEKIRGETAYSLPPGSSNKVEQPGSEIRGGGLADPLAQGEKESDLLGRRFAIEARLEPMAHQRLFGIDSYRQQLREILENSEESWLISIEGMGGVGKTSLADRLARDFIPTTRYVDIAWVSAKQESLQPLSGIVRTGHPALDAQTLIGLLLAQLDPGVLYIAPDERRLALTRLLKEVPYLIIIDNLETAADYQALLPLLRAMAGPTKFLLTSRYSLKIQPDVYCLMLQDLSHSDALAFLRYEGQVRGLTALAEASESQLTSIYDVVGGNPLALKLVIGQLHILPLSRILEQLQQAKSKPERDLYTYIYWHIWQRLTSSGRQALLSMPMASLGRGTSFEHLAMISQLEAGDLSDAIAELARFSLIEIAGDLDEPRYRIHRLTETFLLTEVAQWPTST